MAFLIGKIGTSTLDHASSSPATDDSDRYAYLAANQHDPVALDRRFGSEAQAACSAGADDYLRTMAAHDFAWDDDASRFFGVKFDQVQKQSAGADILTLVSTRAKLSNGFGGFEHISLYCSYDVAGKGDPSYSLTPPPVITS